MHVTIDIRRVCAHSQAHTRMRNQLYVMLSKAVLSWFCLLFSIELNIKIFFSRSLLYYYMYLFSILHTYSMFMQPTWMFRTYLFNNFFILAMLVAVKSEYFFFILYTTPLKCSSLGKKYLILRLETHSEKMWISAMYVISFLANSIIQFVKKPLR